MNILVLGGDGFCGWPTSLRLARSRHTVMIADNLARRTVDLKLSSASLTDIAPVATRLAAARDHVGEIDFRFLDVAEDPGGLRALIAEYRPDAIVQFAEESAAPYSMRSDATPSTTT